MWHTLFLRVIAEHITVLYQIIPSVKCLKRMTNHTKLQFSLPVVYCTSFSFHCWLYHTFSVSGELDFFMIGWKHLCRYITIYVIICDMWNMWCVNFQYCFSTSWLYFNLFSPPSLIFLFGHTSCRKGHYEIWMKHGFIVLCYKETGHRVR